MMLDDLNFRLNLSERFNTNTFNAVRLETRKFAFETWINTASLVKTAEIMNKGGYTQVRGGKLSIADVRLYAIDYILQNPDTARIFYQERGDAFAETPQGTHDWYVYLVTTAAKRLLGKEKFIRWAVRSRYYKKTFHIFKSTYGLSDRDYHAYDDFLGDD